jgi:hypothetical protein
MTPIIVRKAASGKIQGCFEGPALEQRTDIADKLSADLLVLRQVLFENLGQAQIIFGDARRRAPHRNA